MFFEKKIKAKEKGNKNKRKKIRRAGENPFREKGFSPAPSFLKLLS